ncbi:WD domain, G-beta repeat-containing protein [Cardiosporidium cionae]|uniref:WD domain, G-beta repeat-containing protein n=1 Tax=Cardiosporidium cionae TaxID=476202 RepID=A0ABQ7J6G0_9APIC|nr:WD domain, G-beta repeat-containing protein [Cardiosporidium cionae]|eukprot:KAF8819509.1 WD domain, G-beta repeat-containing protein [Cardiosporidium cionae]
MIKAGMSSLRPSSHDSFSQEELTCSAQPFAFDFHPHDQLLAAALVSGDVELYSLDAQTSCFELDSLFQNHKLSCRSVKFFPNGQLILSGGSDKRCIISNINGKPLWKKTTGSASVNSLAIIDDSIFASGDDDGCIKIWDFRCSSSHPAYDFPNFGDYITDILVNTQKGNLVATSGNRLGFFDLRIKKNTIAMLSDPQEDDLLCLELVKNGKKLVCGSQLGSLDIFTWGRFKDLDDRILGHSRSVDSVVKIDENTVCTGAGDGRIRVVSILPNKVSGILGMHSRRNEAVAYLGVNSNKSLLASCGNDEKIKFFDIVQYTTKLRKASRRVESSMADGLATKRRNFFADL